MMCRLLRDSEIMLISQENLELKKQIFDFEKRIENMHLDFYKYYTGEEHRLPNLEGFERELLLFSRRKIMDLELSRNLDRVLYKFQNRKKIWLAWVEETRHKIKQKKQKPNGH
jgi:hypothetical protein